MDVPSAYTADLDDVVLGEIERLLDDAFAGAWDANDWEHTLGGVHVLVRDGGALVGHASVVQRRIVCGDRPLRTGYVEAVAVRSDRRREGIGSLAMDVAERVIVRAYDLGALSDGTGIDGYYERRGWIRWRGPTAVVTPEGTARTPEEDGGVLVLRTPTTPELDLGGTIACDWRPGDVW